jgi:hypothetical protein
VQGITLTLSFLEAQVCLASRGRGLLRARMRACARSVAIIHWNGLKEEIPCTGNRVDPCHSERAPQGLRGILRARAV